jgi:hypothetical protein
MRKMSFLANENQTLYAPPSSRGEITGLGDWVSLDTELCVKGLRQDRWMR